MCKYIVEYSECISKFYVFYYEITGIDIGLYYLYVSVLSFLWSKFCHR